MIYLEKYNAVKLMGIPIKSHNFSLYFEFK